MVSPITLGPPSALVRRLGGRDLAIELETKGPTDADVGERAQVFGLMPHAPELGAASGQTRPHVGPKAQHRLCEAATPDEKAKAQLTTNAQRRILDVLRLERGLVAVSLDVDENVHLIEQHHTD